jgi:aspartate carbamoyltransferase catalytic subunit
MDENPMSPRHLLNIQDLPVNTLLELLSSAQQIIDRGWHREGASHLLAHKTLINLFFETSTRTRVSFELAAKRLGMTVVNIDIANSAMKKGESLLDTLYTLQAMVCHFMVIRHNENFIPDYVAEHIAPPTSVINAGDGTHAHPSQALIDMLTIRQHKGDFTPLRVAIVGDIKHSRAARSQIVALQKLNVGEIRLIGPAHLLPEDLPGTHYHDMDAGLANVDVIMLLRIQKERMQTNDMPDEASYFKQFGLSKSRLKLAKPDAIVMHPGPINRDIEIASELVNNPQTIIYQQVANGVPMRMAILMHLQQLQAE